MQSSGMSTSQRKDQLLVGTNRRKIKEASMINQWNSSGYEAEQAVALATLFHF